MAARPLSASRWDDQPMMYERPTSLWDHIKSCASQHELSEIKNLLGESLVEQSIELHQEIELLLEIWREYRQEMQHRPPKIRLPEPPAQRDRLKAEIKFFVQSIQEKAKAHGRDPDLILSRHNSQIMDYVLEEKGRTSRSSNDSPSVRLSRENSMLRASSRMSVGRCETTTFEDVRTTLDGKTVFQFDDVLQHLRDLLQGEITDLTEDIDFLQNCLEEEVDSNSESRLVKEPTLSELREERSNLEKELLSSDFSALPALRDPVDRGAKVGRVVEDLSDDDVLLPVSELHHRTSPPIPKLSSDAADAGASTSPSNYTPSAKIESQSRNRRTAVKAISDDTLAALQRQLSRNHYVPAEVPSKIASSALNRLPRPSPPSHVTIRTENVASRSVGAGAAQVVHIASIPADSVFGRMPVPPSSLRPPQRPSTAQRFRNMVLECRDGK